MNRLGIIHKANKSGGLGANLSDIIKFNRLSPMKRGGILRQGCFQDPIQLSGSDALLGLSVNIVNHPKNFGHPLAGQC